MHLYIFIYYNIYIYIRKTPGTCPGVACGCSYQVKMAQNNAEKHWLYAVIWGLGFRVSSVRVLGFRVLGFRVLRGFSLGFLDSQSVKTTGLRKVLNI